MPRSVFVAIYPFATLTIGRNSFWGLAFSLGARFDGLGSCVGELD